MKIQCSCGARYELELTPELAAGQAKFVCPACGVNSSAFLANLARQQLSQTSPGTYASSPASANPASEPTPSGTVLRARITTPPSDAPKGVGAVLNIRSLRAPPSGAGCSTSAASVPNRSALAAWNCSAIFVPLSARPKPKQAGWPSHSSSVSSRPSRLDFGARPHASFGSSASSSFSFLAFGSGSPGLGRCQDPPSLVDSPMPLTPVSPHWFGRISSFSFTRPARASGSENQTGNLVMPVAARRGN